MAKGRGRRGGRSTAREFEHHEKGYVGHERTSRSNSWNSSASVGAYKGPGLIAGSGEMSEHGEHGMGHGPGKGVRYLGMDPGSYPSRPTPPGTPPKGMRVYPEGNPVDIKGRGKRERGGP